MYLLDTNIISECRKSRPYPPVIQWIQSVNEDMLYVSAVTLGEIQTGIELTRMQDELKALEIEYWLNQMANNYNIIPMDGLIFRQWAQLMHKKSDTIYEDAMIAATALVKDLTVVTRNIRDFKQFQVALFNPFNPI